MTGGRPLREARDFRVRGLPPGEGLCSLSSTSSESERDIATCGLPSCLRSFSDKVALRPRRARATIYYALALKLLCRLLLGQRLSAVCRASCRSLPRSLRDGFRRGGSLPNVRLRCYCCPKRSLAASRLSRTKQPRRSRLSPKSAASRSPFVVDDLLFCDGSVVRVSSQPCRARQAP